ncbi:hypothetical protein LTS18_006544 [Coniosporium uncinatum]|uniref:Uncharacterized protein n=1 Tax=Coniosporium uncinatum TaxID=93489 RepID=A0ACC3DQD3_9PEZI|nr:hypothetical protein LTS18_006544 [Coniosporium uncinatum]
MQFSTFSTVALLSSLASAHFTVNYPYWRGSSFDEGKSQWSWPCANVTQELSANNRTAWPLTGGSLNLRVSHPWAYTYVTLGLGNEVTSFNVSLLDHFNQTGNGTFCIPQLGAAQLAELGVQEGTNASLQVVQINEHGNALYNVCRLSFFFPFLFLSPLRVRSSIILLLFSPPFTFPLLSPSPYFHPPLPFPPHSTPHPRSSPSSLQPPQLNLATLRRPSSHTDAHGKSLPAPPRAMDTDTNTKTRGTKQCADITFSSTATTLSGDACTNSSNVAGTALMNEADVSSSSSSSSGGSGGSGSGTSGAASSDASPSAAAAAAGAAAPAVGIKGLGMTVAWIAAAVAGVGLVL